MDEESSLQMTAALRADNGLSPAFKGMASKLPQVQIVSSEAGVTAPRDHLGFGYVHSNSRVEVLIPSTQDVTLFGNGHSRCRWGSAVTDKVSTPTQKLGSCIKVKFGDKAKMFVQGSLLGSSVQYVA